MPSQNSTNNETEFQRGRNRLKSAYLTSISAVATKLISLVAMLVTVRWGIDYLGHERYGLWMTITAIVAIFNIADFGINNTLVNIVSGNAGTRNFESIRIAITNAFLGLSGTTLLLLLLGFIANAVIDWPNLLGLKSPAAAAEAEPAFMTFWVLFAISLPLGVAYKCLIGLQREWVANLWIAAAQICGITCLWFAISNEYGLPILIASVMGPPLIFNAIASIAFFKINRHLAPRRSDFSLEQLRLLLSTGGLFFLLQLMSIIGTASDNVVIAQNLGAAAVAEYAVVQRLSAIFGFVQLFIAPLWPAFGDALSRGDLTWAKKTFVKAIYLSTIVSITSGCLLVLFGQDLIELWTEGNVAADKNLLIAFGFFLLLNSLIGCLSTILNTTALLRSQVVAYTTASIVAISLKYILVDAQGTVSGAIWGTIIGYAAFFVLPGLLIVAKYFASK